MRVVTDEEFSRCLLGAVADVPRVVAASNFATPRHLLGLVDATLAGYRLFSLTRSSVCRTGPG